MHFLSELKAAFIRTLKLDDEHIIAPENSHLFAAIGSALSSKKETAVSMSSMKERLKSHIKMDFEVARMEPLFASEHEYAKFQERHSRHEVTRGDFQAYKGNCFLGIDAGSTTTKAALVGEDGELLYSFYSSNNGSPLKTTIRAIKEIYRFLPKDAHIVRSCSTGYGEALVKAALMLDEGEVETVAHYYAAEFFDPKVDCILDIGGQDMKCIRIKNQYRRQRAAERGCSSGCGSFIETFAHSLNYSVEGLREGGSLCGASHRSGNPLYGIYEFQGKAGPEGGRFRGGYLCGLAYSVIKNALFKVIKVSDASSWDRISWFRAEPSTTTRFFEASRRSPAARPCARISRASWSLRRGPHRKGALRGGHGDPPCFPSTRSTAWNLPPPWLSARAAPTTAA